jgi:hypothetical protein
MIVILIINRESIEYSWIFIMNTLCDEGCLNSKKIINKDKYLIHHDFYNITDNIDKWHNHLSLTISFIILTTFNLVEVVIIKHSKYHGRHDYSKYFAQLIMFLSFENVFLSIYQLYNFVYLCDSLTLYAISQCKN